jgi:Uri superfamily endonuclease
MGDNAGGTYTLLIERPRAAEIEVGALGPIEFDAGWYAYVGSALGTGGFSRIDRHRELAAGERDTRHWHIDYLLGHPDSALAEVVTSGGVDGECRVAGALVDFDAVPDFGCTDCGCGSHLFHAPASDPLWEAVADAHARIRG